MYGLWKNKRIVLYDTLIDHCSPPQVTAVLAHELGRYPHTPLQHRQTPCNGSASTRVSKTAGSGDCAGHWKLWHTPVLFVVGQAVLLAQLSLFTLIRANQGLFASFGFAHERPAFLALVLFQYIAAPVDEVRLCASSWTPGILHDYRLLVVGSVQT